MSFRGRCTSDADSSAGSVLVIVLLGMLLLSAMALATLLLATADTLAACNQRDAKVALLAAEAALERAASELMHVSDWDAVLSGRMASAFVDGPASGARVLPNGGTVRLEQIANLANCGATATCSPSACAAVTDDRPWGPNNPRWRPYAYGLVDTGGSGQIGAYVVVLVGDDPSENDNNPERDGTSPGNPGAGIILLRAETFGPRESRRSVEATIERVVPAPGLAAPRVLSWREVRQP
jgi:Tfp pilus assembly protein PilX